MRHGEAVDAGEADSVSDECDGGEGEENRNRESRAMNESREHKYKGAETDENYLRDESDENGDASLFFLSEDAEFESAGIADGKDIS